MKVRCSNIRYKNDVKVLSVVGPGQLQGFFEHGYVSCYDSESAPKELTIDFDCADAFELLDRYDEVKAALEEETGLHVSSFDMSAIA